MAAQWPQISVIIIVFYKIAVKGSHKAEKEEKEVCYREPCRNAIKEQAKHTSE